MTEIPKTSEDRLLVDFALFIYNQCKNIYQTAKDAFWQTCNPLDILLSGGRPHASIKGDC